MTFSGRLLAEPFRLSPFARVRVTWSWFQGPVILRRWMIPASAVLLTFACAAGATAVMVFDRSATTIPGSSEGIQRTTVPGVAAPIDFPGAECHAMQQIARGGPASSAPIVVVMDPSGIPYGPACLVSGGTTGRP